MKISQNGIKFIGGWEGLYRKGGTSKYAPKGIDIKKENPNKYYYYVDPIGLPTIGYGHLLTKEELSSGIITINGKKINYKVNGITLDEVYELKSQDLKRFEDAANKYIKVPITQSMYDSLISWGFNVGAGRFDPTNSTLMKKLNAKDYRGAADEFLKWNRAGGKVLQGLTNRREAERTMFLSEIGKVSR